MHSQTNCHLKCVDGPCSFVYETSPTQRSHVIRNQYSERSSTKYRYLWILPAFGFLSSRGQNPNSEIVHNPRYQGSRCSVGTIRRKPDCGAAHISKNKHVRPTCTLRNERWRAMIDYLKPNDGAKVSSFQSSNDLSYR